MKKGDTWLPKYILVSEHSDKHNYTIARVLAGGNTLEQIKQTEKMSGWANRDDIRIYKMVD